MRHQIPLALVFSCLLLTTACSRIEKEPVFFKAVDSLAGKRYETSKRMDAAAREDMAAGQYAEAARSYEKIYDSKVFRTPGLVADYSLALRKSGQPKKAKEILSPYFRHMSFETTAPNVNSLLLKEYAAANIDLGNFEDAEKPLNRLLQDKEAENLHPEARYMMGRVLDAKGSYDGAISMFGSAIKGWKGDTSPVMGAMAMSYAHRGQTKEALDMLNSVIVYTADKEDIARKIEAVHALQDAPKKKKCVHKSMCKKKKG